MKNLRFIGLALLISVAVFTTNSLSFQKNVAVDCAFVSVKAEYKKSKAIFVGRVVKIVETAEAKTFEFKVEKYWKGVKSKKIKVSVNKTMRFEPHYQAGKSYLIYAFADKEGVLHTQKCTRGFQIEYAKEDLKILGKAKLPR